MKQFNSDRKDTVVTKNTIERPIINPFGDRSSYKSSSRVSGQWSNMGWYWRSVLSHVIGLTPGTMGFDCGNYKKQTFVSMEWLTAINFMSEKCNGTCLKWNTPELYLSPLGQLPRYSLVTRYSEWTRLWATAGLSNSVAGKPEPRQEIPCYPWTT